MGACVASLSFILRLNATSCLGFGITFMIAPEATAILLGTAPPGVIFGLGVLLLGNGVHLVLASLRPEAVEAEVLWFTLGDMAWWLASLALIAAGVWISTPLGVGLALTVACFVAVLGVAQLFALGRRRSGLSVSGQWQRIGQSWMALPVWVKTWLFWLNAVFIAALVLMPWHEARVVLLAYVASGPLLLAFAVLSGGLTRVMGIGHILPWTPLLIWLTTQTEFFGEMTARSIYAAILVVTVAICLAFDFHDVFRWWKGERAIMRRNPGSG